MRRNERQRAALIETKHASQRVAVTVCEHSQGSSRSKNVWDVQASAYIRGYAAASRNAVRGRWTDSSVKRTSLQAAFVGALKLSLPDKSGRATIQKPLL